jgi:hypothetical protein
MGSNQIEFSVFKFKKSMENKDNKEMKICCLVLKKGEWRKMKVNRKLCIVVEMHMPSSVLMCIMSNPLVFIDQGFEEKNL